MVFRSIIRSALEIADAERAKTRRASTKLKIPADPFDRTERRKQVVAPIRSSVGAEGRTKRCL